MTDKIRWGVISTAHIGIKKVMPAIQNSVNGELVAIASRKLRPAKQAARQLGIPRAYGSYEELLADPEIDAIYNPLPNHLHAEWSIRAAEAGKPVLCEKPLAVDAAQAKQMVDTFAGRGLLFAEAFMYRFHPQTQHIKQLVDDGVIGDLLLMDSSFTFRVSDEKDIRLQKEMAGGSLMDVGCYCINVMRLMTGEEPDQVAANAHLGPRSGVDEWLVGTLGFPSGALGHFDCSLRAYRRESYELRGTKGRVMAEQSFVIDKDKPAAIHLWTDRGHEVITTPAADPYQLMVEDFAAALIDGRPPRFSPEDAVKNMQVIDRLRASL